MELILYNNQLPQLIGLIVPGSPLGKKLVHCSLFESLQSANEYMQLQIFHF